jgi:hypothetical protein
LLLLHLPIFQHKNGQIDLMKSTFQPLFKQSLLLFSKILERMGRPRLDIFGYDCLRYELTHFESIANSHFNLHLLGLNPLQQLFMQRSHPPRRRAKINYLLREKITNIQLLYSSTRVCHNSKSASSGSLSSV